MTTQTLTAPAYYWVPEHDVTYGGDGAEFAASIGRECIPEQRLALDVLLAERDGKPAAFESAIICGRQNLKTKSLEDAALYDAFILGLDRIVWTAHRFPTTKQTFEKLLDVCTNYDHLVSRVYKPYTGASDMRIQLLPRHTGPSINFMAREGGASGRGLTGNRVNLDEALYLTDAMLGAFLPTLSAVDNACVRYGSSPCLLTSVSLRRLRNRGRAGGDPSLAYLEWGSTREPCEDPDCNHTPGTPGCMLDDEDRWAQANPALGKSTPNWPGITLEKVRNERRAMPVKEFMRERMGWHEDPPDGEDAIVFPGWSGCVDEGSSIPAAEQVAVGVDVAWDRSAAWIAVAGKRLDRRVHVEIAARQPGTDWVVEWVASRVDRMPMLGVAVQASGAPASSLVDDLRNGIGEQLLTPLSGGDMARAYGRVFDDVAAGQLRHIGQRELDDQVAAAVTRTVGDATVIDRRASPIDVAGVVAVTAACQVLATRQSSPNVW